MKFAIEECRRVVYNIFERYSIVTHLLHNARESNSLHKKEVWKSCPLNREAANMEKSLIIGKSGNSSDLDLEDKPKKRLLYLSSVVLIPLVENVR